MKIQINLEFSTYEFSPGDESLFKSISWLEIYFFFSDKFYALLLYIQI